MNIFQAFNVEFEMVYIPICNIDCDGICYDCPNKWTSLKCDNENVKYNNIINNMKKAIDEYEGKCLIWIRIDWDEDDIVAMRAWNRAKKWLCNRGYRVSRVSFRQWISHRIDDGRPSVDVGCYHGTAYIKKIK